MRARAAQPVVLSANGGSPANPTLCPLPGAGPGLSFLLLSCLYALYCFDYKWSLHSVPLAQRIAYFERHWAFFLGGDAQDCPPAIAPPPVPLLRTALALPAWPPGRHNSAPSCLVAMVAWAPPLPAPALPCAGFGTATVLPMALTSFYTGAALVGLLFPLDIMMAADANPKAVYQRGGWQRWTGGTPPPGSDRMQHGSAGQLCASVRLCHDLQLMPPPTPPPLNLRGTHMVPLCSGG